MVKLLWVRRASAEFAWRMREVTHQPRPEPWELGVYSVKIDSEPRVYVLAADAFDARMRVMHTLQKDGICVHAEREYNVEVFVELR